MTEALNEIPGGLWTLGAAFLTAVSSVAVAVTPRRLEAREQIRQRYAATTEVLASWIELPYRIARRTSDQPGTLQQLAETAHDLQERTANTQAWVAADSRTLGYLYVRVVTVVRDKSGTAAHESWARPHVATPEGMNVGQLVSEQHELDELLTAWTCLAGIRIGWSRLLLLLPKRLLLAGEWNKCARVATLLNRLERKNG